MNHCVPEWDVTGGGIDVAMHPTGSFPPNRGKWDSAPQRKYNFSDKSDKSYAPDNEFEELCWDNGQLFVVTPGQDGKGQKQRSWHSNSSSDFSSISDSEGAVPFTRLRTLEKAGSLEAAAHDLGSIVDSSTCNSYMQEDEMVSWLHYPLDEPLEKYCSELLTDTSNPSKDSERCDAVEPEQSVKDGSSKGCYSLSKAMNTNMDRVNDLEPPPNSRAASNMHSPIQPAATSKRENGCFSTNCSNSSSMLFSASAANMLGPGPGPTMAPPQILPPKTQPGAPNTRSSSPLRKAKATLNFSHFSKPAAVMKERIKTLGTATGQTETERLKQLDRVAAEACAPNESHRQPVITGLNLQTTKRDGSVLVAAASGCQRLDTTLIQQPVQSLSSTEDADLKLCSDYDTYLRNGEPKCSNHCRTNSVVLRTDKGSEILEASEPTLTTSSGGSGNSAGRNEKLAGNLEKKKARDAEDFECQSKGPEEERGKGKKPAPSRSTSVKRSRAAEIHNQSERRRRDRINEKLRALQELIPNSNKTDKASLLEEAIEYLKMLQTQLQMMSFRSGMSVSPMLIPPGMQHLQMPQMASLPYMHMGMGMGMGMGMLDMGAAATSRHVLPLPSFPGLSIPGSAIPSSAVAPVPGHVVATIPGAVLPAAPIPVPRLPVSALPGLPVFTSTQFATIPTVLGAATDRHDLRTSNAMDYKDYHTGQQLQVHPQCSYESQANCNTASASSR